ncbi:MAG: hypothetical protein Fur0023_19410 [Bacteroidia bacterium]
MPFHQALFQASVIFGYKTYLTINDYRKLYRENKIDAEVLKKIIIENKGQENFEYWWEALLNKEYDIRFSGRLGKIMHLWKDYYKVNITKYVQPNLFRIISAYLDQGISMVEFSHSANGFLDSIREIEEQSAVSYFLNKNGRARQMLLNHADIHIKDLLDILVGDEEWYQDYLFDLCFEHPGWSGMVSVLEDHPEYLLKPRPVSLREFIIFELLLQIDYLDYKLKKWQSLCNVASFPQHHLFENIQYTEEFEALKLWQDAFEWTYYYQVLNALYYGEKNNKTRPVFQTIHCIDDREESFRRYIEQLEPHAETFGTAGFFNFDFYYRPQFSNYSMKLAPAPAHPKHIILEEASEDSLDEDYLLSSSSHSLFRGWFLTQTVGFWAAFKLARHIFRPHDNPATISARKHIGSKSKLTFDRNADDEKLNGLYIGYTKQEAAEKIYALLKSIGLTDNFAPIVYIIGHGAGSTNNPYYAAYDCGACSGKPGSVNARVICHFLNDKIVRNLLNEKGIHIPEDTVFIAGLHGTTSDRIYFYDTDVMNDVQKKQHQQYLKVFEKALALNAKERARRFVTMNIKRTPEEIHDIIKRRKFSLFEPRPEYNHATNAVCIVGKRDISKYVFGDRRWFLNSYDYQKDQDGKYLLMVLKAVTPVCGGINLEYYFSRVDNQKLGAGSKLPHNIYGLISVANGAEGDLRYGLPKQMVEIHDPVRLLVVVEQYPDIIVNVLEQAKEIKEWYAHQWIHLVAFHPDDKKFYYYINEKFQPLQLNSKSLHKLNLKEMETLFENTSDNIQPFYITRQ